MQDCPVAVLFCGANGFRPARFSASGRFWRVISGGGFFGKFENGARVCDPQGRGIEKRLVFAMTL
jgi:hypothetical protein